MRLIDSEFRAMNSSPRRFLQRTVEFPLFQRMGLAPQERVLSECHRVLRPGGCVFLEEPGTRVMALAQRLSPEAHPKEASFHFKELESHLEDTGFRIEARRRAYGFGFYCARKAMAPPAATEEGQT
jgi:hypothetical protein